MRQPLLGPDGGDDLGVGIDVDVKEQLVTVRHRETEIGDATTRAVAVVLGILGGLGEFGDRDVWTRQVRIAEAEVDHVRLAARASAFKPLI